MITTKTKVEEVTFTLDAFAAKSLAFVLVDVLDEMDDPQLTGLRDDLCKAFDGEVPEPANPPRTLPPIMLEIPRSNKWNVFVLRSHIYKYLAENGMEYLSRPEDIALRYQANQEALDAS